MSTETTQRAEDSVLWMGLNENPGIQLITLLRAIEYCKNVDVLKLRRKYTADAPVFVYHQTHKHQPRPVND